MWTSDGHVSPAFADMHRAFHDPLLAGCQSTRLESVAMGLRDLRRALPALGAGTRPRHRSRHPGEHQTIADLTLDRDADAACQALAEHIERTTAALIRYAEKQPPAEDGRAR